MWKCLVGHKRENSGPVKTKLSFAMRHSFVFGSYRGVNIKAGQMIFYINQQKCSTAKPEHGGICLHCHLALDPAWCTAALGRRKQFHRKHIHRNSPSVLLCEMESLFLEMFFVKFSKMSRSC